MRLRRVLLLSLVLLPAACAHSGHHGRGYHESTDHAPAHALQQADGLEESDTTLVGAASGTVPAAELPRRDPIFAKARIKRYGKRIVAPSDTLRIEPREGGWHWLDLLRFVSEEAEVSIRYEEQNAVLKGKKVSWIGPMDVARADLIPWVQDLGFYGGLIIVQQGPDDRRSYVVMDQANANLASQPVFVSENDLPALAGRVGLYVSCTLTLPEGVDPSRARQALSQLSTKTAGLGRVNDLGKDSRAVVVADFAAIVANMRRLLDEMALRMYEDSVR